VDFSQSKGTQGEDAKHGASCVGCVTPHGVQWLLAQDRQRPMLGNEKCALQGIGVNIDMYTRYGGNFFSDLAGNAFRPPVVLMLIMGLLVVLGRKINPTEFASALAVLAPKKPEDATKVEETNIEAECDGDPEYSDTLAFSDLAALLEEGLES
jgi:hypothetical protein